LAKISLRTLALAIDTFGQYLTRLIVSEDQEDKTIKTRSFAFLIILFYDNRILQRSHYCTMSLHSDVQFSSCLPSFRKCVKVCWFCSWTKKRN